MKAPPPAEGWIRARRASVLANRAGSHWFERDESKAFSSSRGLDGVVIKRRDRDDAGQDQAWPPAPMPLSLGIWMSKTPPPF